MSYDPEKHKFRGRMPPSIWDENELSVFTEPGKYASEIREMAMCLTKEEALSYYNLSDGDLPPYDQWFFDTQFNRGRIQAKKTAAGALMSHMEGDKEAVMIYLSRFGGGEWTTEPTKGSGKTVPLQVVISDPD